MEQSNSDLAGHLRTVYLTSVEQVEFTQHDGSVSQYILGRIPFRSLAAYKKVGDKVIEVLEAKFKWPVVIVANRTIISTRGKKRAILFLQPSTTPARAAPAPAPSRPSTSPSSPTSWPPPT